MMTAEQEVDQIYAMFDDLLSCGMFGLCDGILKQATHEIANLSERVIFSILTITLAAKHELPARPALYSAFAERLATRYDERETQRLLVGLR